MPSHLLTPDEIRAANALIDPVFLNQPILRQSALDAVLGCQVTLKVETLNPIRSFKGRGTEALLGSMAEKPKGVIATSTGNFGQGLARAATRRRIPCTILVPHGSNPLKMEAMRRFGAEVREVSEADGDGKALAHKIAGETGTLMVEDGGNRDIAAGAGTIGLELTEAGLTPDILVLQLGDGALAGGIASWFRALQPKTRIVGVVAAGAPAMAQSLAARRAVATERVDTIADGLAIRRPIAGAVTQLLECIDEVMTVDDAAITKAAHLIWRNTGLLAEPSGAAGIAAIETHRDAFKGRHVVSVLTGSNATRAFQAKLLAV
jgi:threonine dehydratase